MGVVLTGRRLRRGRTRRVVLSRVRLAVAIGSGRCRTAVTRMDSARVGRAWAGSNATDANLGTGDCHESGLDILAAYVSIKCFTLQLSLILKINK